MTSAKNVLDAMAGYASQQYSNGSADKQVKLAIVDPAYGGAPDLPKVTFEGESDLTERTYAYLEPVNPTDRVVLLPVGGTYVILGSLGGTGGGNWTYRQKTTSETRASTSAVTVDADLKTTTLKAGVSYYVEFHIRFASLLAPGFRTRWFVPAGTNGVKETMGPASTNVAQTDANSTTMRWAVHQYATDTGYTNPRNDVGLQTHLIEKSVVVPAVDGIVQFGWAQLASNATGTVVFQGSFVRWHRMF